MTFPLPSASGSASASGSGSVSVSGFGSGSGSAERAARYRELGLWDARMLADGIEAAAARRPDALALADDEVSLSRAELAAAVGAATDALSARGVQAGDSVVLVSGNTRHGVIAYHGLLRCGALLTALDRRCGAADLRAALDALPGRPRVILPTAETDRFGDVLDGVEPLPLEEFDRRPGPSRTTWPEPDRDRAAVVLFSSGTTGRPKGVVHSINTLTAGADNMARITSADQDTVCYLVSPLTSITGLMQIHLAADHDAVLVLDDHFAPERTLRRMNEVGATLLGGAPVIAERLLRAAMSGVTLSGGGESGAAAPGGMAGAAPSSGASGAASPGTTPSGTAPPNTTSNAPSPGATSADTTQPNTTSNAASPRATSAHTTQPNTTSSAPPPGATPSGTGPPNTTPRAPSPGVTPSGTAQPNGTSNAASSGTTPSGTASDTSSPSGMSDAPSSSAVSSGAGAGPGAGAGSGGVSSQAASSQAASSGVVSSGVASGAVSSGVASGSALGPSRVSLRTLALGGAMLPRPLLDLADGVFGIDVARVYGSSEAPNFTGSLPGDDRETRLSDDGTLMPGSEVRVGSSGHAREGLLRGPGVFLGYLDPEDNAAAFEDGWYRSGDQVELHDGRLTVVGRLKEIVNRNGLKISLTETDAALAELPGVLESSSFAVPDPATGERLAVAVQPADGVAITLDAVVAHLVALGLARRKLPEQLVRWDGPLPRTASGKVVRSRLVMEAPAKDSDLAPRLRDTDSAGREKP